MIEPYPWLAATWQQLRQGIANRRFSHACLLYGVRGIGKLRLAQSLAAMLLCQSPKDEQACGHCRSCMQFEENIRPDREGGHPDYIELSPDDDNDSYRVETIRKIEDSLSLSRHSHRRRVILIQSAELMNKHAANALLRILEEPPAGNYFVLTANDRMRLIATVRSRLSQYHCHALFDPVATKSWLRQEEEGVNEFEEPHLDFLMDLCSAAPLNMLEFIRDNKLQQVIEFYELLQRRLKADELMVNIAPWAAKNRIDDSLEWLLYLVQTQILQLQTDDNSRNNLAKIPDWWKITSRDDRSSLLSRMHELVNEINDNRALLAKNQFYNLMLHGLALKYAAIGRS